MTIPVKTTNSQDYDFEDRIIEELIRGKSYSWVLKWVHANFTPEEVFGYDELSNWADDNGFSKDVE